MISDPTPRPTALAVVVEDEPVLLLNLVDTLTDAGFEVLEATTAAEALRHLSARSGVGLLVTDVRMPGSMNGIVLAHEAAQRWPDLQIVVNSAYIRPQPGQLPDGALFLDKPFNGELLMGSLRGRYASGLI